MDDIDPDDIDGKIETERQWLVATLRRIADRLEALSLEDVIEPLTMISDQTVVGRRPAAVEGVNR